MMIWTVIAVGERFVRTRDPTVPLSGGPLSIFAPQVTQTRSEIECVGAYSSHEAATFAAEQHCSKHPGDRVKIKIVQLDRYGEAVQADAITPECPDCGRPSGNGGRCRPCQEAFWAACRQNDPELLEELARAGGGHDH
jgi:hypothetical protein